MGSSAFHATGRTARFLSLNTDVRRVHGKRGGARSAADECPQGNHSPIQAEWTWTAGNRAGVRDPRDGRVGPFFRTEDCADHLLNLPLGIELVVLDRLHANGSS